MAPLPCPDCKADMWGMEYEYGSPNRYDGVSEWRCPRCDPPVRIGRWTGRRLGPGEEEPRYGGRR